NATRLGPRYLGLRGGAIDERIERGTQRAPGSRLAQSQDDALEMRRQRVSGTKGLGTWGLWTGGLGTDAWRLKADANRPAPFVEDVENVRLAEIDLHRTAPRPLAIVALEAAIDAGARDFERHSSRRPVGDE